MSKEKLYSFYRPHDPLDTAEKGEIVNPWTGEVTRPESMTKQSFVDECDINNILRQYSQTGMLRHVNEKREAGVYADLPDEIDFQQSMNIVIQAEAAFASLPSKLRARFGNDPAQLLGFLSNPENYKEAVELGLVNPPPPLPAPEPQLGPPIAPPKPGGEGGTPS